MAAGSEHNAERPAPPPRNNLAVLVSCLVFVGCMVGAAYAAVPLYNLYCKVTGYNGTTQQVEQASDVILKDRIRVEFDTNVASDLNWDFKPVEDTIALSRAVFDPGGEPGTLSASAFTVGTGATDALDRIVYDSRTGDLFYDPDGIGGAGKVRFAQLTAGLSLTYEDFILV